MHKIIVRNISQLLRKHTTDNRVWKFVLKAFLFWFRPFSIIIIQIFQSIEKSIKTVWKIFFTRFFQLKGSKYVYDKIYFELSGPKEHWTQNLPWKQILWNNNGQSKLKFELTLTLNTLPLLFKLTPILVFKTPILNWPQPWFATIADW